MDIKFANGPAIAAIKGMNVEESHQPSGLLSIRGVGETFLHKAFNRDSLLQIASGNPV